MLKQRKNRSFTLLELMITIAILGVLAALISGNFITSLKKGRDARRKADLEQIQRALEMYFEDNKTYPPSITFGSSLCHPNGCTTRTYMQRVPNDPIPGKNYEYRYNSAENSYRLYACLENNQQILPYNNLTGSPTISCSTTCKNSQGINVRCIWAVSSSNTNP